MTLYSFTVSLITYPFLNLLHTYPASSFIHLSCFLWTRVQGGSRVAAARRVEPFTHRVSINSGSLHLSRAVCEVDVLLAQSFCGFLRMTLSNVYLACTTATSDPQKHHHPHPHQNHRSISPHKLHSFLLWSSSSCL